MSKVCSKFSFLNKNSFMGFAHRGASAICTENTLEAFAFAHRLGFKNFELDVRESADGQVFVCHDDNLERILGEPILISKLSTSEIRSLEVSHGYKIPTLINVLEEFPDIKLNIDAKSWKVIRPLCKVIIKMGAQDRICIGGFNDLRIYSIIRRLGPSVCYSLGPAGVIWCYFAFMANKRVKFNAGCLQIPESIFGYNFASKNFIEFAHQSGLLVHIWTVNKESRMRKLIDFGVDGIMTDNCIGLKKVMQEYELWEI